MAAVVPLFSKPDYRAHHFGFLDKVQANLFQQYLRQNTCLSALFAFQLFSSFLSIAVKYIIIVDDPSIVSLLNCILLVGPICGWLMFSLISNQKYCWQLSVVESLWMICTNSQFGFMLVAVLNVSHCEQGNLEFAGCIKTLPDRMPEMWVINLLLFPLFQQFVARGVKFEYTLLSWAIGVFFTFFCVSYYHREQSTVNCVYCAIFSLCLLVENQRQSITQYKLANDLRLARSENDSMASEVQATELRHMIGNVAHDLKTPLAGLSSGIDTIGSCLADAQRLLSGLACTADTKTAMATQLECIGDSVADMESVNRFMLMTINRCIDYTKCSNGLKLVPRMETVSLKECVELPLNCVRKMQSKLAVELIPWAAGICSHIITDKQWLQENLLCLLSNAVKYSQRGGVTVTVARTRSRATAPPSPGSVEESQAGGDEEDQFAFADVSSTYAVQALRIEVEDTGIGLSDEKMQALFQPFKQAQRHAGGTGLGLFSLARRIEALGGHYGVKRRPDGQEGSLFWFEIPYVPDTVQEPSTSTQKSPRAESSPLEPTISQRANADVAQLQEGVMMEMARTPRRGRSILGSASTDTPPESKDELRALNILVVDDALSIQKMSSMMLKKQGHTVAVAENGADALDKLAEAKQEGGKLFDVVLMDFQMPIMDGIEATRRIRSSEALEAKLGQMLQSLIEDDRSPRGDKRSGRRARRQLIIGVSANSDAETLRDAQQAGIDGFLQKPFSMKAFQAEIARLLAAGAVPLQR